MAWHSNFATCGYPITFSLCHPRSRMRISNTTSCASSVKIPHLGTDFYYSAGKGLQFPILLACFLLENQFTGIFIQQKLKKCPVSWRELWTATSFPGHPLGSWLRLMCRTFFQIYWVEFGADRIKKAKMSPDAFCQAALQVSIREDSMRGCLMEYLILRLPSRSNFIMRGHFW